MRSILPPAVLAGGLYFGEEMNVRFEDDFFCGLPVGSPRTQDERVCAQSTEGTSTGACLSQHAREEGRSLQPATIQEAYEANPRGESSERALPESSQTATSCRVTRGDCLEEMRAMPDNSVDLVFTSPPYEAQRSYGRADKAFTKIGEEMMEALQ